MKRSHWVVVALVLLCVAAAAGFIRRSREPRPALHAGVPARAPLPPGRALAAQDATALGESDVEADAGATSLSEPDEPEPTAHDCALCLQTVCSNEVAAGGSVEAAQCLIPCEHWLPKEMCISGQGPPLFYRARPRPVCPGFERTKQTLALVECGKACPCPVLRWEVPMR